MNSTQQQIIKRLRFRSHLLRRIFIVFSLAAIIMGLQGFAHFSRLGPMLSEANENFIYLADEKQNFEQTDKITDRLIVLRSFSAEASWQTDLDGIQSEFQGFISSTGDGMDVILNQVSTFKNKASSGKELIERLEQDLNLLGVWNHDYYGDIIAAITSPGVFYWPTVMLLNWHDTNLLDTIQFNRSLYLIIMGEVSAGQAILGELRTRLEDSPLRARVMFTQGRLLYGIGRYEQSVEVVQDSVRMDPNLSLAKRFLEYQLSRGPDEEVEEEDESVQRVGTASSGGATLF
jgi:hypothetical protein